MRSNPMYHLNLPDAFWAWVEQRDLSPRVRAYVTFRRTHSLSETVREFRRLGATTLRVREIENNLLVAYINHLQPPKKDVVYAPQL